MHPLACLCPGTVATIQDTEGHLGMATKINDTDCALHVGFGVADVTPPEGLLMAGSLDPRKNRGTTDPLLAKTLYARGGGGEVAIVGLDLIGITRNQADAAIAEASRRTGIGPDAIIISCSHTHSGPYTSGGQSGDVRVDADYIAKLPGLIADSISQAVGAAQPATMYIGRSLVYKGIHHRRVVSKGDGKAVNTWMGGLLGDLAATPQVLGTAGPIDPELWVARFDTPDGQVLGTLVNFSLHANSYFGNTWSADYPCVIAEQIAAAFGEQAVSVFTPGACANINPLIVRDRWREGAAVFAEAAVAAATGARPVAEPVAVAAARRNVKVPRRDPASQREGAIERLNWGAGGGRKDVFGPRKDWVASLPEHLEVPVSAARIGPLCMATNAGELFVECGIEIKRRSPFPHTIVAELTNDCIGYQPNVEAFKMEGYEALVGTNRVSPEGIQMLIDNAVEMLENLWSAKTACPGQKR